MIEHLPECTWSKSEFKHVGELLDAYYIKCPSCAALRECEQRVLDDARKAIAALTRFDEFSWGLDDSNHGDYINLSAALQCLDALGAKP